MYKGSKEKEHGNWWLYLETSVAYILSKPRTYEHNIPVVSINMQVQREQKGEFLSTIIF